MNDFVNGTTCSAFVCDNMRIGVEQKRETAKELLGDMDGILREMATQVAMISDAVYRGEKLVKDELNNEPCAPPPMVVIMQEQRDTAERLLKEIIKIREALW